MHLSRRFPTDTPVATTAVSVPSEPVTVNMRRLYPQLDEQGAESRQHMQRTSSRLARPYSADKRL